jgi:membrane complex biogenesis BtpA family protein
MDRIVEAAITDAKLYKENGIDALMVENMHDVPYLRHRVEPETVAAMTILARAVKAETGLPLGIQVLDGANLDALGVAVAASADFIRVNSWVFAHVANGGLHESYAAQLVRRRAFLKAQHVKIFADIKKKHASHAITSDVSIADTAREAEFYKADAVIVTGSATGIAASMDEVKVVRKTVSVPVLIGSGITPDNVHTYMPYADGLIVGSSLKHNGVWSNHVDPKRVQALVKAVSKASLVP